MRQIDSTIHQVEYYVHSTYLRLLYHLSPISSWAGRDVVVAAAASQACIERRTAEKDQPGACMTAGSPPLKTPVSLFALEDSTRPELISNSVHIFVYIDR